MTIFNLYTKYLVRSYTRLTRAVYSGQVGGEVGCVLVLSAGYSERGCNYKFRNHFLYDIAYFICTRISIYVNIILQHTLYLPNLHDTRSRAHLSSNPPYPPLYTAHIILV